VKDKIIVATFLRVGSTWITTILEQLLNIAHQPLSVEHTVGFPLSGYNRERIKELPGGLYKTHNFTLKDGIQLLNEGVRMVGCQRNFKDTLVSCLLYFRNVRPVQGLDNEQFVQSFIDETAPLGLTDEEFVNLFIEARTEGVEYLVSEWFKFQHVVCSSGTCVLNYDTLNGDSVKAAKLLITQLNLGIQAPSAEQLTKTCGLGAMKKQHTPGHVRKGLVHGYNRYLDSTSVKRLDAMIRKVRQKKKYTDI